jgi:hypothetical protein
MQSTAVVEEDGKVPADMNHDENSTDNNGFLDYIDDDSAVMDPALPEDLPSMKFDRYSSDNSEMVKTVSISTESDDYNSNDVELTDRTEDESNIKAVAFEIDSSDDSEISNESEEEDVELFLAMLILNPDENEEGATSTDETKKKGSLIYDESESENDVYRMNPPSIPSRRTSSTFQWDNSTDEEEDRRTAPIRRTRSVGVDDLVHYDYDENDPEAQRQSRMTMRMSMLQQRAKSIGFGASAGDNSYGRLSRKLVVSMYEPTRASMVKVRELHHNRRRRRSDATIEKSIRKERFHSLIVDDNADSLENQT